FNVHRERNNLAVECVLAANLNRLVVGEDSSFSPVAGVGKRSAHPSIAAPGKDNVHVGLRSWEKELGRGGSQRTTPHCSSLFDGCSPRQISVEQFLVVLVLLMHNLTGELGTDGLGKALLERHGVIRTLQVINEEPLDVVKHLLCRAFIFAITHESLAENSVGYSTELLQGVRVNIIEGFLRTAKELNDVPFGVRIDIHLRHLLHLEPVVAHGEK